MSKQKTKIQKNFKFVKLLLPNFFSDWVRRITIAFVTPIRFSINSGHFKSSLKQKALDKLGNPIPWYSYPAIEFLNTRNFQAKRVLEFGAGQSTIWWSKRVTYIKSFEEDKKWYEELKQLLPSNADLIYTDRSSKTKCLSFITQQLENEEKYDIIVIDGLFRQELCEIALEILSKDGFIIADNSEGGGYNYQLIFKDTGFSRVDFLGHSPGVVLKQGTSFFFKDNSFIFNNEFGFSNDL